eukprot:4354180-Prymnesium_polylepis.1
MLPTYLQRWRGRERPTHAVRTAPKAGSARFQVPPPYRSSSAMAWASSSPTQLPCSRLSASSSIERCAAPSCSADSCDATASAAQ